MGQLKLLLVSVFIAAAVTGLSVPDKNVCKTKECAAAAEFILDRMNTTVDPCDDFYEFACGKFASQVVNKSQSLFSVAAKEMAVQGENVLKKLQANSPKYLWQLRHYIEKCQKNEENKEKEMAAQRNFIRSIGGAHLIDPVGCATSDKKIYTLENMASQMMPFGTDSLFTLAILDVPPPLGRTIVLSLEVPPIDPISVEGFPGLTDVQRTKIRNFQAKLRKLGIGDEKMQPIEKWSKDYPQLNFREYLESKTMGDLPMNASTNLVVTSIAAFEFVMSTYKENKQLVLDYQMIKLAASFIVKPSDCFLLAATDMDIIVNDLVAKRINTGAERAISKAMLKDMKEEIRALFMNSVWLDKETLNKVLVKLDKMGGMFAYSDYGFSDKELSAYYKCLNTTSDTFFELRLNVGELNARNSFKNATGAATDMLYIKRIMMLFGSAIVNAFNAPILNKVFITYPIITKVMHQNVPPFLNYAGIGFVIGHEVGHGFDMTGKVRDEDGNINELFWSNATTQAFNEKAECFIQQFNKYVEPMTNMNVDGLQTLNENMADDYGLKAAYNRAFKNRNKTMVGLPGLNYTVPQQFWMAAAANWCMASTKSEMQHAMETDGHTVNRFRINGGFQNAVEFSNDFQCPKGSKMNPAKRCSTA